MRIVIAVLLACFCLLEPADSAVSINEFMADNASVTNDPQGQYDDWIELHNSAGTPVDVAGMYLTDDLGNPTLHRIPTGTNATIIPANGFLILWADNDEEDGPLHLGFRLGSGGEAIGLYAADGSTLIDSYVFGPQAVDVSTGRYPDGIDDWRSMGVPTPGAANNSGRAGEVEFSIRSTTFSTTFSVSLVATNMADGIYYTIDGTLPTAASPTYSAPINIANTTMLRARAYRAGSSLGRVSSETYIRIAPDLLNFKSDLPIVIIDNLGAGNIPNADPKQQAVMAIFEQTNGLSSITNTAALFSRAGIRRRGESTMRATGSKPNLAVETWSGEVDDDSDIAPLGMPAESDWVLYAPDQLDRTLMLNAFIFEMGNRIGRYAPRTRFVEVFMNAYNNNLSYANNYSGVYVLMERIKRDKNRVDIVGMSPEDNTEPDITGGYLITRDKPDGKTPFALTHQGPPTYMTYYYCDNPADGVRTAAQWNYITNYFQELEDLLFAGNFDPDTGYGSYLDIPSVVDFWLSNLLMKNSEGAFHSQYLKKDRGQKLSVASLWDFDRSADAAGDSRAANPVGWDCPNSWAQWNGLMTGQWWYEFCKDPDYWQTAIDRWHNLRQGLWSTTNLHAVVNSMRDEIALAQVRNFQRWNWNPRNSWAWEITNLKNWLSNRVDWIDGELLDAPDYSQAGGPIATGFPLTITYPLNAIVYYTLDGTDPRRAGGTVSPSALLYAGPIVLTSNTLVRARSYDSDWASVYSEASTFPITSVIPWSAIVEELFITAPASVAVTEVMYHPYEPTPGTLETNYAASDFEFIEIANTGIARADLAGIQFTDGIAFNFSYGLVRSLGTGESAIVVNNLEAFKVRYPGWAGMNIAGEYEGTLDDEGERIALADPLGSNIGSFVYNNARGWPVTANGAGHAIVPLPGPDPTNRELDYGGNWRAGTFRGGSPGFPDPAPGPSLLINEIAAHTDNSDTNNFPLHDSDDWIELYNAASTNVNLGDWYLSDDPDELKKWAIPNTNTVGPAGWIDFDETTGFHNPLTNGFGLNKGGESLFLSYLPGTVQDRVADAIRFKGQENGVSWGRFADGQTYLYTLARTRGAANALASTQRIVMAEVHYHPEPNELHAEDNDEDEYIVLRNDNPFDVTMETEGGPWRMDGEVGYTFPENTVIPAMSEALVVSFDPADAILLNDFLFTYGLTNGQVELYGPWSGKLDNHVGRVALERPQLPDLVNESVSWVLVDELIYFDRNPWSIEADGGGASLHRINNLHSGNAPTNWLVGSPSPGNNLVGFLPVVNNTNGATGIGSLGATLNGALVSTGSAPTLVVLYWGTNDARKTLAGWDASMDLGQPVVGPLGTAVTGLTENTIYYYRYFATNAIGGSWSFPSASFKTYGPPGVTNTGVIRAEGQVEAQGLLIDGTLADVMVYWGAADGGTNAGNWDQQVALGAIQEGAFATTLSGLLYGPCYYYRSHASNFAGEAWADSSEIFGSLAPSGAVYSINNSAPSGITPTSVDVGGTLDSPQAVFDVIAYWGTVDGGTDASAWTKSQFIGSYTNITGFNFGATLNGLNPNTDYFTTFLMTNCSEGVWATPSQTFTTEPEPIDTNAFAHSTKFTFCGYNKNETLTNFPVLIQLGTNMAGFAYHQFNPQATDLRFIDHNLAALNYEIELWDPGGVSYIWVQVPRLVDSNTFVRAYWGHPAETNVPFYTTNGATWSEDYVGVWHMDQTSPPDASGHGNLAVGTSTIVGAGKIGAGIELDGIGAFLDITQNHRLPIYNNGNGNRFTIEGWVKGPDQTGSKRVFSEASTVNNNPVYGFNTKKMRANSSRFYMRDNGGAVKQDKDTVLPHFDGTWHYVAWVEGSGANVISYADGIRDPTSFGYTRSTLTLNSTTIGALKRSVISHYFDGAIDEFRISNEDRSSNWVWATWFNVASNEAFMCSSGAPAGDVDTDGDGMLDEDEMIANTDPLDPNSFLWIQIDQTGTSATHWLTFPTSTGRIYRVESNPDLYSNDWKVVISNLPGMGTSRSLMRTGQAGRVYYRIGVEQP